MKRLAWVSAIGLWTACGSGLEVPKDAATDAPDDPRAGTEATPVDAHDAPADEYVGRAEVGAGEATAEDAPTDALVAPLDGPGADRPLREAGVFDSPLVGERPRPTDGSSVACQDRVLSYEGEVLGASMAFVNSLSFSPDGSRLAAGVDHRWTVWDLGGATDGGGADGGEGGVDAGSCTRTGPATCPAPVTSVAYLPDGRLAGQFCGGQFIIFGCLSPIFFGPFAVSPIGSMVADARTPIQLWDTWTGQPVRTFASGGASSVAFSPDGAILVGGVTGMGVRVWDVASGAELTNLPVAASPADSVLVRVSPNGRWIGALYASQVTIWDLHTYAVVARFAVDSLAVDFAFTRDGDSVITGGSRVSVYAVGDGSLLYQIGARTYVVVVSPDGSTLAASGDFGVPVSLYCL